MPGWPERCHNSPALAGRPVEIKQINHLARLLRQVVDLLIRRRAPTFSPLRHIPAALLHQLVDSRVKHLALHEAAVPLTNDALVIDQENQR